MPVVEQSGTLATSAVEQTLATELDNRSYVLVVDLNAMVDGDTMILRLKREALSGGTQRAVVETVYSGVQAVKIKQSDPVSGPYGIVATLEQPDGASRSIPWSLESL